MIDIKKIVEMDRVEMNNYLNSLDRNDMERVVRAFVADYKLMQNKKVTLTPEQFDLHFRISRKKGKRGRPALDDNNLFKEEQ